MIHPLRVLLLRRLNQAFWLFLLMGLSTWGAWRFCQLTVSASPVAASLPSMPSEFQQLHIQSITSLDSSVTRLRLAILTGQPDSVLLLLSEQVHQQTQEVSLLTVSQKSVVADRPLASDSHLLDQWVVFRNLLTHHAPARQLSQHIAVFQSQVRHLHYRVVGNR